MTAADPADFDRFLERYHQALFEILNGSGELYKELYSQRDDVTLANPFAPFGPISRGRSEVAATLERAATTFVAGEVVGFDNVATSVGAEFAYIVEVERSKLQVVGRSDMAPIALRVTTIFRREDDGWKVVHRHADPIISPRSAESVISE